MIIATANHYWMDTLVATALLVAAPATLHVPTGRHARSGRLIVRRHLPGHARSFARVGQHGAPGTAGVHR